MTLNGQLSSVLEHTRAGTRNAHLFARETMGVFTLELEFY